MITKKATVVLLAVLLIFSLGMLAACQPAAAPAPAEPATPAEPAAPAPDEEERLAITIILGWAAGGSGDIATRFMADEFARNHNIDVTVVNMVGGMGTEAAYYIANVAPDQRIFYRTTLHELMFEAAIHDVGYDIYDFEPVSFMTASSYALVSNADAPWDDFEELREYMKANPGEVTVGVQGLGGSAHFYVDRMLQGLDYNAISLLGGGDANLQLAGDHIDVVHNTVASSLPMIEAGDAKALVNTSRVQLRDPALPDVLNISEYGFPEAREPHSGHMLAPKGTPPELIERVSRAMEAAFSNPDFMERAAGAGITFHHMTPEELFEFLDDIQENDIPDFIEFNKKYRE